MTPTNDQIQEWKKKADKWDALEEEISAVYGYIENNEWIEYENGEGGDLCDIGEKAARAFGFL